MTTSAPPFDEWDRTQLSLDPEVPSTARACKLFVAGCGIPPAPRPHTPPAPPPSQPPPLPQPMWAIGGWPIHRNHRRERRFSALLRGLPARERAYVCKHLRFSAAERRALAAEVTLDRNVREQQAARTARGTARARLKSRCAAAAAGR